VDIDVLFTPFRVFRGRVLLLVEVAMQKRLGVVGIVIEQLAAAEEVNAVLHEYARIIIGRMGLPYRERGVSIISVMVDGSTDEISALTGRLGRVSHVSVKTALTKEVEGGSAHV
jgi:putative iron-only hydrogenase system regulator